MSQALSMVYVHITFSTKYRVHTITPKIRERLFEYIGGICRGLDCNPIQVGGYTNHVHILCLLSKKITQSKLLEETKKRSSKWIKTIDPEFSKFYWQEGYGIFSVKPTDVDIVAEYIRNQEEHHKKVTFQDEFLAFLVKYGIDYDERYIWD